MDPWSALVTAGTRLAGAGFRFLRRPYVIALPFDPDRDLRVWDLRGQISRIQKVFTLEVRNTGGSVAKRCVALLHINASGAPATAEKTYALHWSDIAYAFRTSGAETVDIGPEGRRLDVVFTFQTQPGAGCWIATPAALVQPALSQVHLVPGSYDLRVEIAAENASRRTLRYVLRSPDTWDQLSVQSR